MSSSDIPQNPVDEQKQLSLVQNLYQKTKDGKITWEESKTAITGSAGPLLFNFVRSPMKPRWQLFTVRYEDKEVMSYSNSLTKELSVRMSGRTNAVTLFKLLNELFEFLDTGGRDLEKSIRLLEDL